jgi:predicted aspartyl protease
MSDETNEVSFRLAGGAQPLILVGASVNSGPTHEFILDTGASVSLLTPEHAARSGVEATESKEGTGTGGRVTVGLGTARLLAVGPHEVRDVRVAISDELLRIGAAIGAHVDGDLGYDFLKNFRLTIDYERLTLRLAAPGEEPDGGVASRSQVKFKLAHPAKPLILVPAVLDGEGPYIFAVDTGASTTVVSSELAQLLGIKSASIPQLTGAGGTADVSAGVVSQLSVGGVRAENLEVVVVDFLPALSQAVSTKLDGIVGYNFLKKFRVTIDYPNETLSFD